MKKVQLKLLFALFGLALLATVSFAQKAQPTPKATPTPATAGKDASWPNFPSMSEVIDKPDVRTLKLNSKLMGREMPYQIILPRDYDYMKLSRYPVIYLLHGLGGHYDNWTNKTRLAEYARGPSLIIVTVEGGDGWYTDSVSAPNDKYESYLIQELIPEIDKNFRTKPERENRAIAGLSMGGYGAIKFALKYPDKFVLAGSFSGAIAITDLPASAKVFTTVKDVFGGDDSQTRKENDDFRLLREMPENKLAGLPFLYVACGTEDTLTFSMNYKFLDLMTEKKVKHEYRQLPGGHSWAFWDAQVLEFLQLARRYFQK